MRRTSELLHAGGVPGPSPGCLGGEMARTHGTHETYVKGCRCDPCRTTHNEHVRANRAARLSRIVSHGVRSSYDAGCRCEACKMARREAYVRLAEWSPGKPRRRAYRYPDSSLAILKETGSQLAATPQSQA